MYIAATRRPARVADGWRHTKLLSEQRHGPCGITMPTRGRREGRKSHEAESWRGADATSMTPPRASSTFSSMQTRVLCVLFLSHQTLLVAAAGAKRCRAMANQVTHAQCTARATHALHKAPRWRRMTPLSRPVQRTQTPSSSTSSSSSNSIPSVVCYLV